MKLIILIIFYSLLACSTPKESIPEVILPEKEMVSILKEVHLAEANFELLKTNSKEVAQNTLFNNYHEIYSKYNIDENKFQETLEYYANHPEQLEGIYSKVLEDIKKERSMFDQQ
jgi:hypothetical protein